MSAHIHMFPTTILPFNNFSVFLHAFFFFFRLISVNTEAKVIVIRCIVNVFITLTIIHGVELMYLVVTYLLVLKILVFEIYEFVTVSFC